MIAAATLDQCDKERSQRSKRSTENREAYRLSQWRSLIHIRLGEKEKALEWLEKSYERRDRWMINIKHSPEIDTLRSEPRYLALVKKIGL